MTNQEIAEIPAKPHAQQLINGSEPARLAYNGLNGEPGQFQSVSGPKASAS